MTASPPAGTPGRRSEVGAQALSALSDERLLGHSSPGHGGAGSPVPMRAASQPAHVSLGTAIYRGFSEIAAYQPQVLTCAAELHCNQQREMRTFELCLTEADLIFLDRQTGRPLRQFALLSITMTTHTAATAQGTPACLILMRRQEDSERLFLHVFSAPEVSRQERQAGGVDLTYCRFPTRLHFSPGCLHGTEASSSTGTCRRR